MTGFFLQKHHLETIFIDVMYQNITNISLDFIDDTWPKLIPDEASFSLDPAKQTASWILHLSITAYSEKSGFKNQGLHARRLYQNYQTWYL